jgi:hypothetical protein
MRTIARLALVLALHLAALLAHAQDEPLFLLESITVEGVSPSAARIVIAESRIDEGKLAGEPELRDAMARIQRLPFVLSTDFRLAKGSAPERYILVITIRPTSRVFLNSFATTSWVVQSRRGNTPLDPVSQYVNQIRSTGLTVGGRTFVGAKGMLTLAAERVEDRNDRFSLAFTQYDLFGTRASISAIVTSAEPAGAIKSFAPDARNDWHHRDNLTYEIVGVLPLGRNDSLRASWERSAYPLRYFEPLDGTSVFRSVLRPEAGYRKELFWIHDTTNDPIFPTSGTRITAGAIRFDTPTAGSTLTGRVKIDEYRLTAERSWPIARTQAVTAGAAAREYDSRFQQYRGYVRYSVDLWGREQTIRWGDLRLEIEGDRELASVNDDHYMHSTARVGFAYRGAWGVLRMNFQYVGWEQPRP